MIRPVPRPNPDGSCDECRNRGWVPLGEGIRWRCPVCKGRSEVVGRRLLAEAIARVRDAADA